MVKIDLGSKTLALARIKNGDSLEDISKVMNIPMGILNEWDAELGEEKHRVKALNLAITEKATAMINSPGIDKAQLEVALANLSLNVAVLTAKNMLHYESLMCLKVCSSIITDLHKTLSDQNGTTIINQPANDSLALFNSSMRQ